VAGLHARGCLHEGQRQVVVPAATSGDAGHTEGSRAARFRTATPPASPGTAAGPADGPSQWSMEDVNRASPGELQAAHRGRPAPGPRCGATETAARAVTTLKRRRMARTRQDLAEARRWAASAPAARRRHRYGGKRQAARTPGGPAAGT
jgi:hypothetical protein